MKYLLKNTVLFSTVLGLLHSLHLGDYLFAVSFLALLLHTIDGYMEKSSSSNSTPDDSAED